jgi:tetratricopeptide (TPR) repeat protein
MKAAEFNANLLRVRQARLHQTAVRQKVASINGPPTYVRQMVGESIRKARFNAMGDIIFEKSADRFAYEAAVVNAPASSYQNQTKNKTPGIEDDAPTGRGGSARADRWSFLTDGDGSPNDDELWLQSEKAIQKKIDDGTEYTDKNDAIVEHYKTAYLVKHGPMKPPFKGSTMMVSHLSDKKEEKERIALMAQVGEIQTAIEKLERAQVSINGAIKDAEAQYYAAEAKYEKAVELVDAAKRIGDAAKTVAYQREAETAKADMDALQMLLNGGSSSIGLRWQAMEIRDGVAALMRQRTNVSAELGIDPEEQRRQKRWARFGGFSVGNATGGLLAAGAIIWWLNRREKSPATRRGAGRSPIDIFS